MGKIEINNYEDLFQVLDRLNESIDWNTFYADRVMKAPFLVNNTLPDKMITEFVKTHNVKDAVEFGCGEGRNAIYLAKRGIDVLAVDSSEVAIRNAKDKAEGLENARFICSNFLTVDFEGRKYDLVIDSGMFHHLPPHRRLQYRELLKAILKETDTLSYCVFRPMKTEPRSLMTWSFTRKGTRACHFRNKDYGIFSVPILRLSASKNEVRK